MSNNGGFRKFSKPGRDWGMREKSVTLFQKSVLRGAWEQDNQSNAHGVQFQFQYRRRRSVRRTSSTTYASD